MPCASLTPGYCLTPLVRRPPGCTPRTCLNRTVVDAEGAGRFSAVAGCDGHVPSSYSAFYAASVGHRCVFTPFPRCPPTTAGVRVSVSSSAPHMPRESGLTHPGFCAAVVGCLAWLLGVQRLLLALFAHLGVGRPCVTGDLPAGVTYQRLHERSDHPPTPLLSYHNALKMYCNIPSPAPSFVGQSRKQSTFSLEPCIGLATQQDGVSAGVVSMARSPLAADVGTR